jgi:hypothetical protein
MTDNLKEAMNEEMDVVLGASPFLSSQFNEHIKQRIHEKIKHKMRMKRKNVYKGAISVAIACLVISLFMALINPGFYHNTKESEDWQVRQIYKKNGEILFTVNPDPLLEAGKRTGYMISFNAPFEEFSGKSLEIDAIHKDSGIQIIVDPGHIIKEPSPGYPSLGRYVTFFGLPLSGVWRYQVKLNGVIYGDAVLHVNEPSWTISPLFKTGVYQVRGIEKNIGIIDNGFFAGKRNKFMWHFWGDEKKLDGPFQVTAVKKGSNQIIHVFSASFLAGALNGADRITVSSMSLPTPGLWRLMAYVNDQMLGSIVVDVK